MEPGNATPQQFAAEYKALCDKYHLEVSGSIDWGWLPEKLVVVLSDTVKPVLSIMPKGSPNEGNQNPGAGQPIGGFGDRG